MPAPVSATLHTDPGCPWAYSAIPALRVLEWRYGDQHRLAARGDRARGDVRASTSRAVTRPRDRGRGGGLPRPLRHAVRARRRRPACPPPRAPAGRSSRPAAWRARRASGRCCGPSSSPTSRRRCCSTTTPGLAAALAGVPGVDADAVVARLDAPDVTEAYERDRAEARTAAGSPTELAGQDRHHRRARALHRALRRVRARRPAPRGGRVADRSRPTTSSSPTSTPTSTARDRRPTARRPAPRALPRGAHHAGGRGAPGPRERRPRPGLGGAAPHPGRRRRDRDAGPPRRRRPLAARRLLKLRRSPAPRRRRPARAAPVVAEACSEAR